MEIASIPILYFQLGFTGLGIILFFIGNSLIRRIVKNRSNKIRSEEKRIIYTIKFFKICWGVIILTIISLIWDISFKGLSLYFASVFTVIGVAFFAQWSMISNVTASVILFFSYSYKIGNRIKVMDGDNSVIGKIIDIKPFFFQIQIESGEIVNYPNNLILQKPIIQLHMEDSSVVDPESKD